MKDYENYEKKYKCVLDTARQWIKDGCSGKERICLECCFPELRESEDERIRKEILEDIRNVKAVSSEEYRKKADRWIAWLEKQKEQKPTTKFKKGDWVVYDGILGHGILQVADVKDGRYTFVDNESTLLAEDSDVHLRPLAPKDLIAYNVEGFKAGAEWQKEQISEYLDKWEEHAIRGMKVGASAYHQGKIALICDLRDWMKGGGK